MLKERLPFSFIPDTREWFTVSTLVITETPKIRQVKKTRKFASLLFNSNRNSLEVIRHAKAKFVQSSLIIGYSFSIG